MISHLYGILDHVDTNHVIIDVNNVGYHVKVPAAILNRMPAVGEKVKLLTVQIVKEDDVSLYGFLAKEERALFTHFLSVSGVGPKTAMAVISGFPIDKIISAVACSDVALISSIPGIGKKTAERIIVELKEKFAKVYSPNPTDRGVPIKDSSVVNDSIAALISLGYSHKEAREAVSRVALKEGDGVETVVKQSLKALI
ncbi:MAG: Holliday junction branch migration protein RuvA [Candidatus Margulisiibacteriota bacterium]